MSDEEGVGDGGKSTESSPNTSSCSADWPVTEEWLLAVLREHHHDQLPSPSDIAVLDFTVRPGCETGESVLSDILAVAVKYRLKNKEDNYSLSFVIKLLPQDPFSRFFVTEAQFDLREIKFYTQVVPDLERFKSASTVDTIPVELPIPKCYYAHYSSGTTEPETIPPSSVLVLENIKPKGYRPADFRRGLTLHQAVAAVEAVSVIHGLSLSMKLTEGKSPKEIYPFLFQTSRASDSYQQLVERGFPQLKAFLSKMTSMQRVVDALEALKPHTKEIIEKLLTPNEPMALITHTDFWCNNLMFDGDESTRCVILDWQMVTYSRPTNDLALLLVSSLPAELRRNQTDFLLDAYWKALLDTCRSVGVDVEGALAYGRAELGVDYRKSQLLALLLCIGSVDVALGDELTEGRLVELLADLHGEGLLERGVLEDAC